MSDNVTAPASGIEFLSEDIGGGLQLTVSKLSYGPHGTSQTVDLPTGLPVQPQSGSTWPMSAAALPLPTGAATSTAQGTAQTTLASILSALQGTLTTVLSAGASVIGAVTQSGVWNITNISGTISLPTGAATNAAQTTAQTSLSAIATAVTGTQAVSVAALPLPTGAASATNQTTGNSSLAAIATSVAGTLAVSAAALPLPTGAATATNQASAQTSLSAIAASVAGTLAVKATGSGTGSDASQNAATLGTVLGTFTVTTPGAFYVQNQSAGILQVAFSDGLGGTPTIILLNPGYATNTQGGATDPMPWFTGQIQVCGTGGSQFAARHN